MGKKWIFIGLAVLILGLAVKAAYTLYSGVADLKPSEQQVQSEKQRMLEVPVPVIPVQAELSNPELTHETGKNTSNTTAGNMKALSDIQMERGAPPSGPFSGRDPEGLSYAERIQKESEYVERGRQIMEQRRLYPEPGSIPGTDSP